VFYCIKEAPLQPFKGRTRFSAGEASIRKQIYLVKARLMTITALQEGNIKLRQSLSRCHIHVEIGNDLPISPSPTKTDMMMRNHHPNSKGSFLLENSSIGKYGRPTISSTVGDNLEVKQATVVDKAVPFIRSIPNAKVQEMLQR
jgi:hypothetical protein